MGNVDFLQFCGEVTNRHFHNGSVILRKFRSELSYMDFDYTTNHLLAERKTLLFRLIVHCLYVLVPPW